MLNYPPDGSDYKYLLELRAEAEYYGLTGLVEQIDRYPVGAPADMQQFTHISDFAVAMVSPHACMCVQECMSLSSATDVSVAMLSPHACIRTQQCMGYSGATCVYVAMPSPHADTGIQQCMSCSVALHAWRS